MSAHAVAPASGEHQRVLETLHEAVGRFGIRHATIQLEDAPLKVCRGDDDHSRHPLTPAHT
jgi:hypothetical protein